MKDFVTEFNEKQYVLSVRSLMTDTVNDFIKKEDIVRKKCVADIERAIKHIANLQVEGVPAVNTLVISIMYTSVYFNKPQLRLDFYHEPWVLGEAIYSEYMDVEWLFAHWQEHKSSLADSRKNLRTWIHESHLESLYLNSVRILGYVLFTRLKYWIQDLKKSDEFNKLQMKSEFYIFFGEYMDWQKPIFAVLPQIDIFNCNSEDSLRFREFKKCRYNQKNFSELNLSMSSFKECTFENCTFEDVDVSDAVFENCKFSNTNFSNVKMSGVLFLDTQLKDVNFNETIAIPASPNDNNKEMYRNMDFDSCVIENMQLHNCEFVGAFLTDCLIQGVKIDGGDYKYSDFLKYQSS